MIFLDAIINFYFLRIFPFDIDIKLTYEQRIDANNYNYISILFLPNMALILRNRHMAAAFNFHF